MGVRGHSDGTLWQGHLCPSQRSLASPFHLAVPLGKPNWVLTSKPRAVGEAAVGLPPGCTVPSTAATPPTPAGRSSAQTGRPGPAGYGRHGICVWHGSCSRPGLREPMAPAHHCVKPLKFAQSLQSVAEERAGCQCTAAEPWILNGWRRFHIQIL